MVQPDGKTVSQFFSGGVDEVDYIITFIATYSDAEIEPVDAVLERRAQWIGHLRLPDQLGESLGPISAIQGGDHQPRLPGATDPPLGGCARLWGLA